MFTNICLLESKYIKFSFKDWKTCKITLKKYKKKTLSYVKLSKRLLIYKNYEITCYLKFFV